MYSFSGWYRSQALGFYRAFATNFDDTVVLSFASGTVVLSPELPEKFVRQVSELIGVRS